jgi:hypothetical protein
MLKEVMLGQSWSIWIPGRQQWLLATVIRRNKGQATLALDPRYGVAKGQDEQVADESTMLGASNLYRLVEQVDATNSSKA